MDACEARLQTSIAQANIADQYGSIRTPEVDDGEKLKLALESIAIDQLVLINLAIDTASRAGKSNVLYTYSEPIDLSYSQPVVDILNSYIYQIVHRVTEELQSKDLSVSTQTYGGRSSVTPEQRGTYSTAFKISWLG